MATYANLTDCADPGLVVTESNLADADVFVLLSLKERGFSDADIAGIALPNTILTAIAVAWAKRQCAIENAVGENSFLIDKARQHEKTASTFVDKLTRDALGLSLPAGAGFGQIVIGRA